MTFREGFSPPDACFPLQACLSRLSNLQVDRLLTYLAKWMDKYTQKLGEHASGVLLPKELFFPTLSQACSVSP